MHEEPVSFAWDTFMNDCSEDRCCFIGTEKSGNLVAGQIHKPAFTELITKQLHK